MANYTISEKQFEKLTERIILDEKVEQAKKNWESFSDEQKEFVNSLVETLYPKKSEVLKEAWYNTVMDILGIIDPTPVVDIINAVSYFAQGESLFGALTLIGAIPYAGDVVAKPVLGALKIGGPTVKALEGSMKLMTKAKALGNTAEAADMMAKAEKQISTLAKGPGPIGSFLQKMGKGFGDKIIKTLDDLPAGPFKGFKNTIRTYIELLTRAAKKSRTLQVGAGRLASKFRAGTASVDDVAKLKDWLKTSKVFDAKALSKPGFFTNAFFGGIPRLFRSADGRRLRVLMQSTKWWLGFLDYIGLGNWVGPEELSKKMGEGELQKKIEEYNATPQARQNFEDQFGSEEVSPSTETPSTTQSTETSTQLDPFAKMLRGMFQGQLNPLPGM